LGQWTPDWILNFPVHFKLLPEPFKMALIALVSGMVGSFLNMAIWRVPRRESIVFARSHCPACGHVLGVKDLVPVLSYLFLRGRCSYCSMSFGSRYVLIELGLVLLGLVLYTILDTTLMALGIFLLSSLILFLLGLVFHARIDRNLLQKRKGFTYIEVMLALVIVAAVIIPFGNMFLSNYARVLKNKEYIIAYNLLEEKLEELKLVPFSKLRSDYLLYAKPARREDGVFVDEHVGHYQKLKSNPELFYQEFSDIQTEKKHLPDVLFKKFKKVYEKHYRWKYHFYPPGYEIYRRTVKVEAVKDKGDPKFERRTLDGEANREDLVKITVTVWVESQSNHRKLELSTYRRR
jgi:prepilin signal peptidase PulO-like enzyme (type II secretory pathway)